MIITCKQVTNMFVVHSLISINTSEKILPEFTDIMPNPRKYMSVLIALEVYIVQNVHERLVLFSDFQIKREGRRKIDPPPPWCSTEL